MPIEDEISQQEIYDLMKNRGLTVEKVLDVVIDVNGWIGVGLITLGDLFKDYIYHHPDRRLNPHLKIEE